MPDKFTKKSFEKYLDEIINKCKQKWYEDYLLQDLLDIKNVVIKQRRYKNWNEDKIITSISNKYDIFMYGIKEPPLDEELYKIICDIKEGVIFYEFYK